MSCAPKGKKEGRMLAGLHLKHCRLLDQEPCRPFFGGWRMLTGLHHSLRVQLPPLGRCRREKSGWERSRRELSPVRLLGGRMLVGTTSLSKITVSVRFVCRPLQV